MPKPITREDVIGRMHAFPMESYALIANVAKGIGLGVSGFVFLQILANLNDEWPRLIPWLASMAMVLISYMKWSRGTFLCNARSNVYDTMFPLLMGVAELMLFAVLARDTTNPSSTTWLNWCAVAAIHSFLAVGIVHNRIRLTKVTEDFAPNMLKLGSTYISWLVRDRWQAGLGGTIALGIWALTRILVLPNWGAGSAAVIQGGFASLCVVFAWKPISEANSQRNYLDEYAYSESLANPMSPQQLKS